VRDRGPLKPAQYDTLLRVALHGGDILCGQYGQDVSRIKALLNGGYIEVVLTERGRDLLQDEIARWQAMPPGQLGQVTFAGWEK